MISSKTELNNDAEKIVRMVAIMKNFNTTH